MLLAGISWKPILYQLSQSHKVYKVPVIPADRQWTGNHDNESRQGHCVPDDEDDARWTTNQYTVF